MHLISFTAENYRSIREAISLDNIGDVEILHGANNAGKSNLLGAMSLAWALLMHSRFLAHIDTQNKRLFFHRHELELTQSPHPHHDRPTAPTRLVMVMREPDIRVELRLQLGERIDVLGAEIVRDGSPWHPPDHVSHPADASSGVRKLTSQSLLPSLGLPRLPFVLVSNLRQGPGGKTWDQWLIDRHDADTTGTERTRYAQVEEALGRFVQELGEGTLSRVRLLEGRGKGPENTGVELAWVGADRRPTPFSEQGSGMRQIKDILCAVLGSPAPIIALEEPETNLSERAQLRLRTLLHQTARQYGKQIFLTSHVYTFDGPDVRRVFRKEQATRLEDGASSIAPVDEDTAQSRINSLYREYVASGSPSAEFVAETGILKLPPSVLAEMTLPEHLIFSPLQHGGFLAVPDSLLRQWREEQEEGL